MHNPNHNHHIRKGYFHHQQYHHHYYNYLRRPTNDFPNPMVMLVRLVVVVSMVLSSSSTGAQAAIQIQIQTTPPGSVTTPGPSSSSSPAVVKGEGVLFVPELLCEMGFRHEFGCTSKTAANSPNGDLAACCVVCATDTQCEGASLDASGQCWVHDACPDLDDCAALVVQLDHTYMARNNE